MFTYIHIHYVTVGDKQKSDTFSPYYQYRTLETNEKFESFSPYATDVCLGRIGKSLV